MLTRQKEQGFTLIELLLVVVIIGILLAVIVPRAWRANIDSKYGLVRQNASELASFGSLWAEQQIEASVEYDSVASMYNYLRTLTRDTSNSGGEPIQWIALAGGTNWPERGDAVEIEGRSQAGSLNSVPENSVEEIVPIEKIPRNPFNGASVFQLPNDPETAGVPIPGAIACGWQVDTSRAGDGNWAYFGFVFQGTDNTSVSLAAAESENTFLAGQDRTLEGLRNGIFFARTPVQDVD